MNRLKLRIDGPGGKIETVINDPGEPRRGLVLIAHPHLHPFPYSTDYSLNYCLKFGVHYSPEAFEQASA